MDIFINLKVGFQRPSIGPKHYIATGSSGWVETFPRDRADKALKAFIGRLEIEEMVSNFLEQIRLAAKETGKDRIFWHDVTSYLGRIIRIKPEKIPYEVGVAFWAHVVMIQESDGEGN
jgi:hypothetical protein